MHLFENLHYEDLAHPIRVTQEIDCDNSEITHLSKYRTFEKPANFLGCYSLKVATGNFLDYVNFEKSSIEKIENLEISPTGANFFQCNNLKTLENLTLSPNLEIEEEKLEKEKERRQKIAQKLKENQPQPLVFKWKPPKIHSGKLEQKQIKHWPNYTGTKTFNGVNSVANVTQTTPSKKKEKDTCTETKKSQTTCRT
jgi:hypothetical protein